MPATSPTLNCTRVNYNPKPQLITRQNKPPVHAHGALGPVDVRVEDLSRKAHGGSLHGIIERENEFDNEAATVVRRIFWSEEGDGPQQGVVCSGGGVGWLQLKLAHARGYLVRSLAFEVCFFFCETLEGHEGGGGGGHGEVSLKSCV